MDEVSPSTRRAIHADEQRDLRWKAVKRAPFVVLAIAAWIATGPRPSNPLFFVVGLTGLPFGAAAWEWWRHRKSDPLAERLLRAADRDAKVAEAAIVAERLATRGSYVTNSLAGVLVVIAVLQLLLDGSIARSVAAAGLVKPAIVAGQWWRLISATYLHGSWWHINGNLGALLVLGRFVEAYAPRWKLPVVYACAGAAGSLASFFLLGKTSVGASGAIMGLAGYLAAKCYLRPDSLPQSARRTVLTIIGMAAYLGAFGFAFIDNAAHAGGLAAGALIAWLTISREDGEPADSLRAQPQWNLIGAAAAVLIIAGAGGTVVALAHGRPAPVKSVTFSLPSAAIERRPARGELAVVVTNKSNKTIEAYRVSIHRDGQVVSTVWRDDCCFSGRRAQAPIAPHETRTVTLMPAPPGFGVTAPTLQLDVVVFDDGTFEGSPDEFDKLMAQRKWAADSAAYWLRAIDADRGLAGIDFYTSMATRMRERLRQSPMERPAVDALGVSALITGGGPASQLQGIDQARASIAAAERALRDHLARAR